jgi:hypothetical protein
MITFKHKGNFSKTEKFFNSVLNRDYLNVLSGYGKEGVQVLSEVTPKRTGLTAASWTFEITQNASGEIAISFLNTNIQNGENIAIILDVGHATKRGGWVRGRHYIDPAIQPIFDRMAEAAWKEVTRL